MASDDRALCDYAVKLTLAPGQADEGDLDRLRQHGLTDAQLTVAVQVIGYFNYINRVADGLGVDDELGMDIPRETWLREKANQW